MIAREKIVWQYVGTIDTGNSANFNPLPLDGFDFIRIYVSTHGAGSSTLQFSGSTSLPGGYEEKDNASFYGDYIVGNNVTQIIELTAIASLRITTASQQCATIIQGIKYE